VVLICGPSSGAGFVYAHYDRGAVRNSSEAPRRP
jgi:hypothetical protein